MNAVATEVSQTPITTPTYCLLCGSEMRRVGALLACPECSPEKCSSTPRADAMLEGFANFKGGSARRDYAHCVARNLEADLTDCRRDRAALIAALETVVAWQDGSPLVGGRGLPAGLAEQARATLARVRDAN